MSASPLRPARRAAGRLLAGLLTGQLAGQLAGQASRAAGLAGGAGGADDPPSGSPLIVAAFPAVDAIVREASGRWAARQAGVPLQIVSRQFNDHHTAMTTALSTASNLPDVMALEVGYVGRFALGHGLENLAAPAYGLDSERQRCVPYAMAQGTSPTGAQVAVPTDIGPGTLLYRHDLLERSGVDLAALTSTWEGFVGAGAQLKARTGALLLAHARDLKDILIRTGLAAGEGLYFNAQSEVLVQSPRFQRAFELARSVRRQGLDARVTAWSNDWSEGFRRGTIATQMSGAWLAGHLANWLAPQTAGRWRAAQLPEGAYAAYGGTFFAIPRALPAARKARAWALVRLLTFDRAQQLAAFRAHDAFPALRETYDDAFFAEPMPFLGGQPARLLWREAALRIQAPTVHKQDAFADEVINTELDKVMDQGKAIAPALADAARLLARRAHR